MVKKSLLQMPMLMATNQMMKLAAQDAPQKHTFQTYWGSTYTVTSRKYRLFLRCKIEGNILRVSLYLPDSMRLGARRPAYETFIEVKTKRFLTYDYTVNKWRSAMLDNLDVPTCNNTSRTTEVWLSHADQKKVKTALGCSSGNFDGIVAYQHAARTEVLIRRDQRTTDKWDQDMALTPALPKDWNRWVDKVGIPEQFMFYAYKKGRAKTGYCSYCEREVPLLEKPRHGKSGTCPRCRHKVTFKSIGRLPHHFYTENTCVYLMQRRPDGLVIREFWAYRTYYKENYQKPKVCCTEHLRHLYDPAMCDRHYYWGDFKHRGDRWLAGLPPRSFYSFAPGYAYYLRGDKPGRIYGKTLPSLHKGILKSTGLVEWLHANHMTGNPMDFLYQLKRHPILERIAKAHLPQLTEDIIRRDIWASESVKNPEAPSLAKSLGIDTQRIKRLRQWNGGYRALIWLQWEKSSGRLIHDSVIQWLVEEEISPDSLKFILDRMNPVQICNYLKRQAAKSGEDVRQVLSTWQDYLSMASGLGIDTNDEIVYRVKKLRLRHDELMLRTTQEACKEPAVEIQKAFPDVDHICQSLQEKYAYGNKKYQIVVPKGVADILAEGKILCHCVARNQNDVYWDRISRHETYLLFLRKADAPHVPYYTLEVEPDGTIRQKRTKFDRQEEDIEQATQFLKHWQKVIAKRLTTEDRQLAATSRVLREEEFKELREKDVRIYVGDFQGQRLVDVLTADLLETDRAA